MNNFFKTTLFLMLIANMQWAFILANYTQLKEIEAIEISPTENKQETYLKTLFSGVGERWNVLPLKGSENTTKHEKISENNNKFFQNGFLKADMSYSEKFEPVKIVLPTINKEAPIIREFSDIDDALNRGVVLFNPKEDDNRLRTGLYIFGHSSSFVAGPYQYIFTKLPNIKRGEVVALEGDESVRVYELVDSYIKFPDQLSKLPDSSDRLFLITCYPLLTSYKRYVSEFKLIQTVDKNLQKNKELSDIK